MSYLPLILTIPKSGTHLLLKLLALLINDGTDTNNLLWNYSSNENTEFFDENIIKPNILLYEHPENTKMNIYYNCLVSHPNRKIIVLIRDLRDIFTSSALSNYVINIFKKEGVTDKNEILNRLITNNNVHKHILNISDCVTNMVSFIDHNKNNPNFYIVRFENLIGEKGNGTKELQINEIINISKFIGLDINQEKIAHISNNLFGTIEQDMNASVNLNRTFRNGQIGSWKDNFSDGNLEEFYKSFGNFQEQLGYS